MEKGFGVDNENAVLENLIEISVRQASGDEKQAAGKILELKGED